MVSALSYEISRVSHYSGFISPSLCFHIQDFHLLWFTFPGNSTNIILGFIDNPNPTNITIYGLGSSCFARHYFRNRCYGAYIGYYIIHLLYSTPLVSCFVWKYCCILNNMRFFVTTHSKTVMIFPNGVECIKDIRCYGLFCNPTILLLIEQLYRKTFSHRFVN